MKAYYIMFFSCIALLGAGTLWHLYLQRVLQCIKHFIVELPPLLLSFMPPPLYYVLKT
jgi:hypothetical protein